MTDREAFEACPDLQDYCDFSRCPDGTRRGIVVYNDPWTQGAWLGWQAALASERAKQVEPVANLHDNKTAVTEPHPMLSATHFCRDCRALWRQCDDFSMNLRSTQCCDKCNNAPVADQLTPLTATPGWWHGADGGGPFRLTETAYAEAQMEIERLRTALENLRRELDRAWREVDFIAKERTEHLEWRTQLANDLGECELIRDALGRALNKRENDLMLLRNAVDAMMAPLGYHGEISARDDRVQAVMDALAKIDAKEGT